ncbi:MAG: uroporphyrinogen-III synthase, partial [Pseudomonadota bacterium]|nr:uroporphyrinogen-III synthase [Pseudomonadota bacterium]
MSGETLLITRPQGDGEPLADLLHSHGFRTIHEPLTTVFLRHEMRQALHRALLAEPDAVIATSRFAVQALAALTDLRDCFLLCVGEATAEAASSVGFLRNATAGGNGRRLIDTVLDAYDPASRFLYISGEHTRVNMEVELSAHGMQVSSLALYEAASVPQLSDTLLEQLRRRQIDGVTFLSARAAEIFLSLLAKAQAEDVTANLHAFCLSSA